MEGNKGWGWCVWFFKHVTIQQTYSQDINYVSLPTAEEFHLFHTKSGNNPQTIITEMRNPMLMHRNTELKRS